MLTEPNTDSMIFQLNRRFIAIVYILSIISFTAHSQIPEDCAALKSGVFYSYPKNTADRFVSYRDNGIAKEYDLIKGDSSIWKVDWKSNCSYSLKFVSGSAKQKPEVAEFLKKHIFFYTIQSITSDYYVFNGYIDKPKGDLLHSDTMWLHEKINFTPNRMFEPIANMQLKKAHFSDTSSYAIVYLYRPGKLTNSVGEGFVVSLDDLPMAVMKNKSGFIFKIFQPGNHVFASRLGKDESKAILNIELGKRYYIKAAINWGFYSFRNYKLEMKVMEPAEGKIEFEDVDY